MNHDVLGYTKPYLLPTPTIHAALELWDVKHRHLQVKANLWDGKFLPQRQSAPKFCPLPVPPNDYKNAHGLNRTSIKYVADGSTALPAPVQNLV